MCGSINRARHTPSRRHNPRPAISGTGGLRLTCVAVEVALIAWHDAEVDATGPLPNWVAGGVMHPSPRGGVCVDNSFMNLCNVIVKISKYVSAKACAIVQSIQLYM